MIIHQLVKEQHQDIQESVVKNIALDINDPAVQKLAENILQRYGKKSNTAYYGVFRDRDGRGTFPDKFIEYFGSAHKTETNFISLSKEIMSALYIAAQGNAPASGGYIVVTDYEEGQDRFIVIAMIKKRPGITLSEKLIPELLLSLDLDKLNQAAKINFTKFAQYQEASADDKDELNYLSFVSPDSNKSASGYFVNGLGCKKGTASANATKALFLGCKRFFREIPELKPKLHEFTAELEHYLDEKEKAGMPVRLSEIEAKVRNYYPIELADRHDEFSEQFFTQLKAEENEIPHEFSVSRSMLNKLTSIKYKTDNWNIQFDRASLGDKEDAEIYYDKNNQRLVLTQLSGEFKKAIEEQLNENNKN